MPSPRDESSPAVPKVCSAMMIRMQNATAQMRKISQEVSKAMNEQGKASRPCIADKTRQKPGAARIRHQADARERLDKRRLQAGNDDIAGERNVASGAGGDAVDRGDDRKGEGA